MDNIELEARRSEWGLYSTIPQQNGGQQAHLLCNADLGTGGSKPQNSLSPKSISKSILTKAESQQSPFRLPPKSFFMAPTGKRIWKHVITGIATLLLVMIPIGIMLLAIYTSAGSVSAFGQEGFTYCSSYGLLPMESSENSFSALFNINVAFGKLSFGTAKIIDLVWDFGVSRCSQAMLGWITYQVNTAALLHIMETHPVSYEFYSSLSFSWTSIASLVPVTKAFFTKLGFRKKILILWMVVSIIWVAMWPIITNAMTGYIAENDTLVKLKDNTNYGEFKDVGAPENLAFQFFNNSSILLNGSRPDPRAIGPILTSTGPNMTLWNELNDLVKMKHDVSQSISDYNSSHEAGATFTTTATVFYYYQNQSYTETYFENSDNVQCVATGVYQWGFSLAPTYVFAILNALWFIGTYGVWIHMNRKSTLCQKGRRLGKYRAALDIAESINQDLGTNTCAYSEKELGCKLAQQEGVKYYVMHSDGDAPSHIGISSKRDRGPVVLRFGELYGCKSASTENS